jgi:hypothetical protein
LGLAPEFYPTNSFPGEIQGTVGYYGYTGKKYSGETDGDFYGPKYSEGDTIGVGITNNGDAYFTRNGLYLGVATTFKRNTNYFITIAFRSKQVKVACNYGNLPFKFQFAQVEKIVTFLNFQKSYEIQVSPEVQKELNTQALDDLFKKCSDSNRRVAIAALVTLQNAIHASKSGFNVNML